MTCYRVPFGIVCVRGQRRKRCATCQKLGSLECDGCDRPLCAECSVSPGKHPDPKLGDLDYCPTCCRQVFKEWCAGEGAAYRTPKPGITELTHKMLRRAAFRKWAKEHPGMFQALRKEPR